MYLYLAVIFFFWAVLMVKLDELLGEVKKGNKDQQDRLKEINQDAGDIKRRQTWSKKREKKTLKKI